ncbi:NAD-dependent succinate-semialdehyde dehydrogenase [Endothiovibrio diazotrophicus]
MGFRSINPATGETLAELPTWDDTQLEHALAAAAAARAPWAATPLAERCALVRRAGEVLRARQEELARLISLEMGKLIGEARAEVEKSALGCNYYADHAETFLAAEPLDSDAGKSYVAYQPLGAVLAVMPWNFPFWQVFRFAAPALCAGNVGLLKHASNVPQCAQAIEEVWRKAGAPEGVFTTLMIEAQRVAGVIRDPRVAAVTLTGSEAAGRQVAATAGEVLKKSVLELGGSDPFVVLEDADLEAAAQTAVLSRFLNGGQSCIAAKRFIVVESVADEFVERFKAATEALRPGDPLDESTTLAPMARPDLREEMQAQIDDALAHGAVAVTGCEPIGGDGCFYAASILDRVAPGMRVHQEEVFGPCALVIRVADEAEALRVANDIPFGLGGSVWSEDRARGEAFAARLECGCAFVNGLVKSDPRLPFGGIKASGYGRELSRHGIREFVNAKTVWIR